MFGVEVVHTTQHGANWPLIFMEKPSDSYREYGFGAEITMVQLFMARVYRSPVVGSGFGPYFKTIPLLLHYNGSPQQLLDDAHSFATP